MVGSMSMPIDSKPAPWKSREAVNPANLSVLFTDKDGELWCWHIQARGYFDLYHIYFYGEVIACILLASSRPVGVTPL